VTRSTPREHLTGDDCHYSTKRQGVDDIERLEGIQGIKQSKARFAEALSDRFRGR
jgi:hypothetical protein